MKGAMGYLVFTRLKAQVREVFKRPSRLIYLLLLAALFGLMLLGGSGETEAPARDARELPILAGAFYGLMFVVLVNSGFKNGASMFSLSDVNLLFPAPIRPRTVLYYGLVRQLGTSLLLGLFLLFQYGWLHSLYGIGGGMLVLIVALYGVSVFLAQVVAMLAYSFTSASPRPPHGCEMLRLRRAGRVCAGGGGARGADGWTDAGFAGGGGGFVPVPPHACGGLDGRHIARGHGRGYAHVGRVRGADGGISRYHGGAHRPLQPRFL